MNPIKAVRAAPSASREDWVEMQLVYTFMRYARPALHSSLVLVAVLVAILHGKVDSAALGLWSLATLGVTLFRYRVLAIYHHELKRVTGKPLRIFMARYGWTWPLSAVVWGSSMFVFFVRAPIYDQFVCMMILIGMAGFAVGTFSSHLRSFSWYVNGLAISVLAALLFQLVVEQGIPGTFNTYGMVALVIIYWIVIRVSGYRFHEVQKANLELQFDNSQLIASLTERSRAALEAVAIKNRFIASAAHDLRQPVHALALYADWLVTEPEFVAQIAPRIVRSTRAVNDMFDSLFDMAGIASDAVKVHWQPVDLVMLIQDLEVQYEPLAYERNLQFRTRARVAATVRTDPTLLKRMIGNLLTNAFRNTPTGGVLLALRRRGAGFCIEIWDSGVGIPEEHQRAIFQEFYRVPLQGTEEGFGLGLAIVSRLAEALDHPLSLSSRPGRGTVFRIELKASDTTGLEPLTDA